jgi:hypothetical protein
MYTMFVTKSDLGNEVLKYLLVVGDSIIVRAVRRGHLLCQCSRVFRTGRAKDRASEASPILEQSALLVKSVVGVQIPICVRTRSLRSN